VTAARKVSKSPLEQAEVDGSASNSTAKKRVRKATAKDLVEVPKAVKVTRIKKTSAAIPIAEPKTTTKKIATASSRKRNNKAVKEHEALPMSPAASVTVAQSFPTGVISDTAQTANAVVQAESASVIDTQPTSTVETTIMPPPVTSGTTPDSSETPEHVVQVADEVARTGKLPPNYKRMARHLTALIVALPFVIVGTPYVYDRVILGNERKVWTPSTPTKVLNDEPPRLVT